MRNKRAGMSDLFIFMIFAFVIILICGVFIYMGITITDQVHETMDDMEFVYHGENITHSKKRTISVKGIARKVGACLRRAGV